jgi:hypothetical protein
VRALRRVVDSNNPDSYANRLRERRFALFRSLLERVPPPIRILDVGGTPTFWQVRRAQLPAGIEVVILNLEAMESTDPNVTTRVGDALDMRVFADREFDVVFSNAVIEHVATLDNQVRMGSEIRRVGRRYFVQTPNRRFPLEPHFLVPGFQFLPISLRAWLLRRFPLGWYARTPDRAEAERKVRQIRLMTESELLTALPGSRIHRERVFGLTKSLIAYGGWEAPPPA